MKAKTLRLPEDIWRWLRREAFEREVTQQSIIEESLRRTMNASDVSGPTFDPIR